MSRSIVRWGAAGLGLALGASTPALAQSPTLQAGGVVEGEVRGSGSPASFSLRAAPGQTLQLDAIPAPKAPDGLDLMVKVYDAAGDLVAEDDDGGGALNPRVTLVSQSGGTYRVEVDVLGEGGAFTLLARESVFVPEVTTPLTLSGGKAERNVAFPDQDDALFTFAGRRGEIYSITLVADSPEAEGAADPMLELFQGEGTARDSILTDDDSGGGLNARLVADLPEDGTYTVRVSTLSGTGSARLAVSKLTLRPAPVNSLSYGSAAMVGFTPDSPFVVGESARRLVPYALYRLPAAPAPRAMAARGETIVITATSEGLAPYLEVGLDTPLGFAAVLSNDDADGLNARVVLDPAKFGEGDAADWWSKLRIRVSAPPGSAGEIELTATPTGG
ncbi:MAG TPA: hypothetical protein VI168_12765 [Croceibacterium sp.]